MLYTANMDIDSKRSAVLGDPLHANDNSAMLPEACRDGWRKVFTKQLNRFIISVLYRTQGLAQTLYKLSNY